MPRKSKPKRNSKLIRVEKIKNGSVETMFQTASSSEMYRNASVAALVEVFNDFKVASDVN